MDCKITYAGINESIVSNVNGKSILDVSIEHKIPHVHECGGNGKCTTCRVRILGGTQNLTPKTHIENRLASQRNWDPSIRLACQSKIKGDITIQRLIWSNAEISNLQKEAVPEENAEERSIAILFCDIRNYTALSAKNESFDIAYFLNRFYTELGEPILMNNGIIYQYVGDEIIGVFGTEENDGRKNCEDAMRAALSMRYSIERLNKTEFKDFDVKLKIGIGINFGKAFIGHLGHPTHRQFSVIGDPVNVASRIQGQTKLNHTDILISKSVMDHFNDDFLSTGKEIRARLAGKNGSNILYELMGFNHLDLALELQSSIHDLLKEENKFAELFYQNVFAEAPAVENLFQSNIQDQGRLLTHMLGGIVYSLSRPEYLKMGLKHLGSNHIKYGVKIDYFPIVKKSMLKTIREILGEDCRAQILKAWDSALDFVIEHMSKGMRKRVRKEAMAN